MNHVEISSRLEQAYSAEIGQLFWIAAQWQSSELQSLLEDLDDEDWSNMFPKIFESKYFDEYKECGDGFFEPFFDFKYLGFVAEVLVPNCNNFIFTDGKPSAWSINSSIKQIYYVYAETLPLLIKKVEESAKKSFDLDLKKFKERNSN